MQYESSSTFSGMGSDRVARRILSRSTKKYQSRQWPVSVRGEQNDFDLVAHPVNVDVSLSMPKFFLSKDDGSMETFSKTTLSKPLTHLIGRTTIDGSRDFSVRTIYVGIVSLNDWHCRHTIESIFGRAKYPERIRVGVVDQLNPNENDQSCDLPLESCSKKPFQAHCQYRSQIDVYEMESDLAVGPTFARHVVERLYRGEYYVLQINSHTTFTTQWDVEIIEQLEGTGNEMAVLTTYLDEVEDNLDVESGISQKEARKVICNAAFEGSGHDRYLRHPYNSQPDLLPGIEGMPQLQPYYASQFVFARGHFILTVPHDPHVPLIQTEDEEVSMALRAFTHGYDCYTPQRHVCFDSISRSNNDGHKDEKKENVNSMTPESSLERLYGLLGMSDSHLPQNDDMFGIGSKRPLNQFYSAFGIHPQEHITEQKLCDFVSTGKMHQQFYEHLKADGMGLNYDLINFRFHELQNNHEG